MFLFGHPIGVRHLVHIASDQMRRLLKIRRAKRPGQIHFVYFSCARDIALLKLSLSSLVKLKFSQLGAVYVVVDRKGQFNDLQKDELISICPVLHFLDLGNIDWASVETLSTELQAFDIVSAAADRDDFIAKVDSDILFFSAAKLKEVSFAVEDFVGDGHYSRYEYAQGGLYFVRASLARQLYSSTSDAHLKKTIKRCRTHAEDQIVSALINEQTKSIWLTRLMLFPNEYEKSNINAHWVRQEFSAIHFVHKKSDMPAMAAQLNGDQHAPI